MSEPDEREARPAVLHRKPRSIVAATYVWKETDRWISFPWSTLPRVVGTSEAP